MPAEVAEAEGLVTKPNHSNTNKWGPIVYNRDHHPLHIMVKILSSIIAHVLLLLYCCSLAGEAQESRSSQTSSGDEVAGVQVEEGGTASLPGLHQSLPPLSAPAESVCPTLTQTLSWE